MLRPRPRVTRSTGRRPTEATRAVELLASGWGMAWVCAIVLFAGVAHGLTGFGFPIISTPMGAPARPRPLHREAPSARERSRRGAPRRVPLGHGERDAAGAPHLFLDPRARPARHDAGHERVLPRRQAHPGGGLRGRGPVHPRGH